MRCKDNFFRDKMQQIKPIFSYRVLFLTFSGQIIPEWFPKIMNKERISPPFLKKNLYLCIVVKKHHCGTI